MAKFKTKKQYQTTYSLTQRQEKSKSVRAKYPNKIPCIVSAIDSKENPEIDNNQFLVEKSVLLGTFLNVVKKRLIMKQSDALFLFIKGCIPVMTKTMQEIYNDYADNDGFLYLDYSIESTFG